MMRFPKVSRAAVVRSFKAASLHRGGAGAAGAGARHHPDEDRDLLDLRHRLHLWQGSLALKVDLPVILGHEMVGRIVATGSGTDRDSVGQPLRVGDRITGPTPPAGRCYFCTVAREPTQCQYSRKYMYERMDVAPYLLGGFSEYGYVLPDSGRVKVPDRVPNELASMASCAFRSVMNAFDVLGRVDPADTVVVQGAGPLGLLATAVAKVSGRTPGRHARCAAAALALAREFGAD